MDLRYAFRVLYRSPGFTAIAVLTLALGIGINTIVFTMYSAVAWKPIAAKAPEELVRISGNQGGQALSLFSYSQFEQIGHSSSFTSVLATSDPQTIVARLPQAHVGDDAVVRIRLVSNNFFQALGVPAAIGRTFVADDGEAAVVSYDFWVNKLGRDPAILRKALQVQGTALQVVGVAPEKFAGTGMPAQMPDLWIPMAAQPRVLQGVDWVHDQSVRSWQVIARRRPGVGLAQASAELEVLAHTWPLVEGKPAHLEARRATFFQTDGGEFQTFGTICEVLMVAVALVLLIGSINLVNLLFARHAAREREFAVRLAMGANRLHLVRQLCTESLVLGAFGGSLGLLFSLWACDWIRLQLAGTLERLTGGMIGVFLNITPDWHVFAYTAAISLITGVAVGLWPALRASRPDVSGALKQASGGSAVSHGKRSFLISAQVAACLVLLAGAGMLFRGVWRSGEIDPGFDMHHVLVLGMNTKVVAATSAGQTELIRRAVDRISAIPGVTSVAWSDRAPFLGHSSSNLQNEHGDWINYLYSMVSDRYFETLGIPLVAGRTFTAAEVESGAGVMVISDVAARRLWPGKDALGRSLRREDWQKRFLARESYTVIGVVKGVRSTFLSKPDEPFFYYPDPLTSVPTVALAPPTLLVRTRALPAGVSHSVVSELGAINPNLPAQTFEVPLDQAPVELQRMMAEAPAMVALMLGALALLLASIGVFGVASQLVTQRTREIAIRVSLGAQARDVIRMVVGQTLRPVSLGAVVGLAGALAISALLAKMIVIPDMPDLTYGAGAFDPVTFLGVLAVLTVVVALASLVPVRRATAIAPADALRNE